MGWEKYAIHLSDRVLSKIFEVFLQVKNKKTNNPIFKCLDTLTGISQKTTYKSPINT